MMRLRGGLITVALVAVSLTLGAVPAHAASFVGDDLQGYYPNTALYQTEYLQGQNYVVSPPSYAVLWFERQDQYTFLQHNYAPSDPQARCHTDYLSWWPDQFLRYVKTVDSCNLHTTVVDYGTQGNPIIYLPEFWNGNTWSLSGSSPAVYSVDGQVQCTGTNDWTAQIFGVEEMAPGEFGLHWRSNQTLTLNSTCAPTTHWQEDYWLVQDLPSTSGPQKGLKRTQGGDLDRPTYPDWNIWMDDWATLP